jgi:hypothetical protein
MNNKEIYYSCCTSLCYEICGRYYNDEHYVWCTPYFNPTSRMNLPNRVPPTSSPCAIYWNLRNEIEAGDMHSAKIDKNRAGIIAGARAKFSSGVISAAQYYEIKDLAALSEIEQFWPLILVIPRKPVDALLKSVEIRHRANLMSEEYIIECLPRKKFHAIEFDL